MSVEEKDAAIYQAAQEARDATRQIAEAYKGIDRLVQEIERLKGVNSAAVGRALELLDLRCRNLERVGDGLVKVDGRIMTWEHYEKRADKARFVQKVIDQEEDLPPFGDDPALMERLKPLMTQKYRLTATVSQMGVEWNDPALVSKLTSIQK